jgi:hypothetical protein
MPVAKQTLAAGRSKQLLIKAPENTPACSVFCGFSAVYFYYIHSQGFVNKNVGLGCR